MLKMFSTKWLLFTAVTLFYVIQDLRSEHVYNFKLVVKSNSTPQIHFKFKSSSDGTEGISYESNLENNSSLTSNTKLNEIEDQKEYEDDRQSNKPATSTARLDEVSAQKENKDRPETNTPAIPNGDKLNEVPEQETENKDGFENNTFVASNVNLAGVENQKKNEDDPQNNKATMSTPASAEITGQESGAENITITLSTPTPEEITEQEGGAENIPLTLNPCPLPPNYSNGEGNFSLTSGKEYNNSTNVDHSTDITLTYLSESGEKTQHYVCSNGSWIPIVEEGLSKCRTLPPTDTYFPACYYRGLLVSCEKPTEGSTATLQCERFYQWNKDKTIICQADGTWSPKPAPCTPECGRGKGRPLLGILNGLRTLFAEYQWIVGIYKNQSNQLPKYVCAGSIISRTHILTAAHCFTDSMGRPQYNETYIVAAGKKYRNFNVEETLAVVQPVKKLFILEGFKGSLNKYQDDIGIVEVEKPYDFRRRIQPVCIDWNNKFEDKDFTEGTRPTVNAWSIVDEDTTPAEYLSKSPISFRTIDDCRKNMAPEFFNLHNTSDKVCAGDVIEGSCRGDGGSGLYFETDASTNFVRGVSSLSGPTNTGTCDNNHYALFTKVSKYLPWIKEIIDENV